MKVNVDTMVICPSGFCFIKRGRKKPKCAENGWDRWDRHEIKNMFVKLCSWHKTTGKITVNQNKKGHFAVTV